MPTRRSTDSGEPTRQGRVKDKSRLSTDPVNIRKRLRKVESMREQDLQLLIENDPKWKPLEQWDLEELARGRPRNKNGGFVGRGPAWITPMIVAEAQRRFKDQVFRGLTSYAEEALKVLYNIMMDEDAAGKLRSDIAMFIVEHVIGKPKTSVDVTEMSPASAFLAKSLVLDDDDHTNAHPVIELEPTEYEDGDDDDE